MYSRGALPPYPLSDLLARWGVLTEPERVEQFVDDADFGHLPLPLDRLQEGRARHDPRHSTHRQELGLASAAQRAAGPVEERQHGKVSVGLDPESP